MWSTSTDYSPLTIQQIADLLGDEAQDLLTYQPKIPMAGLHLPNSNFVKQIFSVSNRSKEVVNNLERLFNHGRLAKTGYLSILPVDQGVEHAAGFSFYKNPTYFDPESIVRLALEGGCNGVASTFGVLGAVAKKYADKIPLIVKINHNELLSYPNVHDQIMFGTVQQAADMGAVAVGATVYFGSPESRSEIVQVAQAFAKAHELGLATILWAYVRNPAFTLDGENCEKASDITGQANYLAATMQADIIKQKMPESAAGLGLITSASSDYGKFEPDVEKYLIGQHVIDWTRYQVLNNFAGRIGLLNSGGASGSNDIAAAVKTAVINKRAGGMGIIAGRKAFQRPFAEGVQLLHAIQDVYLNSQVTVN